MLRTTSTGGVKLVYNGKYDEANKCNNTGEASQIGESKYNENYKSPADIGYMYGTRYTYNSHSMWLSLNILNQSYVSSSSSPYYYSTSIIYSNGTYTLENAEAKSWSDNYSNLTGYYTCQNSSTTCSTVYYIAATENYYQYVLPLTAGESDPNTQIIRLGKSVIDNGNNTYTLTDVVTLKKIDWYTNYSAYNDYYICPDLISTTCDSKYLVSLTRNYLLQYDNTFNYVYGNDISWDGEKYTAILTDNNNVLFNYSFSASISGIHFSVSGDKLTIASFSLAADAYLLRIYATPARVSFSEL